MSETPIDDALEQSQEVTDVAPPAPPPGSPPVEADEADAVEQATDVPIDEEEYR